MEHSEIRLLLVQVQDMVARRGRMDFQKEAIFTPWTETPAVDQRTEFVLRVLRNVEHFGTIADEA